jgi:hypothetical protein
MLPGPTAMDLLEELPPAAPRDEKKAAALVSAARVDAPGVRVLENGALLAAKDERPVG